MKDIDQFAEELETAYSTDRYRGGWRACIKMLRSRGYNDLEIEAIIRSKWTRWAGDSSDNRYGRVNSADLARYLDRMPPTQRQREIDSLVRETFGSNQP